MKRRGRGGIKARTENVFLCYKIENKKPKRGIYSAQGARRAACAQTEWGMQRLLSVMQGVRAAALVLCAGLQATLERGTHKGCSQTAKTRRAWC